MGEGEDDKEPEQHGGALDVLERVYNALAHNLISQVALGYLAAALAVGSGYQIVAQTFGWPPVAQRLLIAFLAAGLPVACALAWLRGNKTRRRRKLAIVGASVAVGVALLLLIGWDWSRPAGQPQGPVGPVEAFRDCSDCPEMAVIPAGSFMMGSADSEDGHIPDEGPRHNVTIPRRFALGRYEVTWAQWDVCVRDGACSNDGPDSRNGDAGWGRGALPVMNVDWNDAKAYAQWLSAKTGRHYRLPSESEWEYAARARSTTPFIFADNISPADAVYAWDFSFMGSPRGRAPGRTSAVGSFPQNGFGLYDMFGNVWEWVEDCYVETYAQAPANGEAVESPDCDHRVRRGGSWFSHPEELRSATRYSESPRDRFWAVGFRVALSLDTHP